MKMNNKTLSNSHQEDPKLISAVVIVRHGARTPKERFNANPHWPFDGSPGQLTSAGWQQAFLMGELLRSHYAPYPILLQDNNSLKEIVTLRSTNASRCIETAKAILTGFLQKNYMLHNTTSSPYFDLNVCQKDSTCVYDDISALNSQEQNDSKGSLQNLIGPSPYNEKQSETNNESTFTDTYRLRKDCSDLSTKSPVLPVSKSDPLISDFPNINLSQNNSLNDYICNGTQPNLSAMDFINIVSYSNQDGPSTKSKATLRVKQLKKESLENSIDYKRLSDKHAELIEHLQSLTGWSTAQGLKVVKKFESASGSFQHHSKKLPDEVTDDMLKHINKASAALKRLKYSNPEVGWLSGGAMLTEIINQFNRIIQQHNKSSNLSNNDTPKDHLPENANSHLTVYVTHQSALLDLQASLGITHKNLYLPNFAGSIFAELIYIKETDLNEEDYKSLRVGCQCFQDMLNKQSYDPKNEAANSMNRHDNNHNETEILPIQEETTDFTQSDQTNRPLSSTYISIPTDLNSTLKKKNTSMDALSNRSKTESLDLSSEWSSNESCDSLFDNSALTSVASPNIDEIQSNHLISQLPNLYENSNKLQDFPDMDESTTSTNETRGSPPTLESYRNQLPGYYIRWTINGHNPLNLPLSLNRQTQSNPYTFLTQFNKECVNTMSPLDKTRPTSQSESDLVTADNQPNVSAMPDNLTATPHMNKTISSPSGLSQQKGKPKDKTSPYKHHIIELAQLEAYVEEMTNKYGSPMS